MSPSSRVAFCLLALLITPSVGHPRSASSFPISLQSSAESAARAVVEQYFLRYASEDLDGLMSLWSGKSPDHASFRQRVQTQFEAEDFSFSDPLISHVKVETEKASVRATTNLAAINPKTNSKRDQRLALNFALVMEDGKWKIWRSALAEDDLAEVLVKVKTEAERATMLAAEKELVTADLARALINQAGGLYGRGEYQQALIVFHLAQSIGEEIGDRIEVGRALRNTGHVHRSMGNNAEAMAYFQKSLAIFEAIDNQTGIGLAFMGIGLINVAQGNFAEASEHYQKGLRVFEALGNRDVISRFLNNIAALHRHQGDYVSALETNLKALAINQELGNKSGTITSLGNIGVVYSSQGNYAKALDYYQKSLVMSEEEDDKEGIAITLGNIGVLHRKQGNYAQALDYYRKSLTMSETIEDKVGIAQMLSSIGTIAHQQGNDAEALDYYRKSLAMREASGDKEGSSDTMMAIGTIHTSQGNHAQAQEYYQKSLAIKEAINDKDGTADVLLNIGIDFRKQGDDAQALRFAERATALARESGNLVTLWNARVNAGLANRALNKRDEARQAFEEAIAVIETMRNQVAGGEQDRQRFFEDKLSPYHAVVDLLVAQNSPTEGLIYTERAKARALLDMLRSGRVDIVKAMTSQEREQERKLRVEIISLNTQVTRATQDKLAEPKLNELKSRREKARLNYEAFQSLIYAAHPELRVQRGEAQVIRAEEIAALAPDARSALLAYVVMDDVTYLFAVTRGDRKAEADVRVYTLPIKRVDLGKQTELFRQQLAARNLGFRRSAAKLYDLLLKPAAVQLQGKTNLIIAPDDKLWELPFQALSTGTNRYLIEDAAIAYAPSLTALREMTRRRKQGGDNATTTLLALGNPLSGREAVNREAQTLRDGKLDPLQEAEQEVKALSRLYGPSRCKVYTGAEAREDRVKTEASQARILHFAAHGMLNNASPMYSHLVLAEGGANDGLLEAWELMQLDLKADLAVLSACETARGHIGAGEGMIGLSWAMFIAGVPSIVVSQWKVESAGTRDLMVNFHRVMITPPAGRQKPPKAEALRQAALKLMKNPETRHPFYWAGFVLIGDGR